MFLEGGDGPGGLPRPGQHLYIRALNQGWNRLMRTVSLSSMRTARKNLDCEKLHAASAPSVGTVGHAPYNRALFGRWSKETAKGKLTMDARLPVRRSEALEQSKQATEDDETAADDLALVHARPNSKLTGDEIDTDMARAVADSQDVECVSTGRPRLSIKLNRTLEQQVVPITVIEGRAEGLVSPEGFGFGLISVRFGGFPTCSASRKAIVSATQLGRPAPTCRALDLCRGRHTE